MRELRVDCDADALLVRVEAIGPGVCHEGYRSCFFRKLETDGSGENHRSNARSRQKLSTASGQEKKA